MIRRFGTLAPLFFAACCASFAAGCGGSATTDNGFIAADTQGESDTFLTTPDTKTSDSVSVEVAACTLDSDCTTLQVTACQTAKCVAAQCKAVSADAGTACNDSDACTSGDQCKAGKCVGVAKACNDQSVCTTDSCDPATGACTYAPNTATCDDGDLCTENDSCAGGKCVGTLSATCGCKVDADCAKTDDADLCNGVHSCQNGKCATKPGSVVTCDASKAGPCATIACEPKDGSCKATPLATGTACDDGDKCTKGDACAGDKCVGSVVVCDDSNPCTDDSCAKVSGCAYKANATACSDGDLCTNDDKCSGGKCAGTANPNCSKCTTDADCGKFEDGDLCNGTLACTGGVCGVKAGTVVTCAADANVCKIAACEPTTGKCATKNALTGDKCDDSDACTSGDHCDTGACLGGKAVTCSDGNPCTTASCDKASGCVFKPSDGATCDDGNPCTNADKCVADKCTGTASASCAACKADADCAAYEDANLCNGTLSCVGGLCGVNPATVVVCDTIGLSSCVQNDCVPATGKCKKTVLDNGAVCDDQNACTDKDYCSSGVCKGQPIFCDDAQLCTDDACNPDSGCTHKFNSAPCDDGNVCTASDACKNGACGGSPVEACQCTKNADCIDDGDLCNGTLICAGSKCVVDPTTVVSCAVSTDACSPMGCDAKTGKCLVNPLSDGKPCDDKNACTSTDTCVSGKCQGGAAVSCDDGNLCTDDKCKADFGCTHSSNTAACDDSNKCTSGDTCAYGQCQPGKTVDPACADKCVPNFSLVCGGSDSWGNGLAGSTNIVKSYTCNAKDVYDGPEYAYVYTAPYDGSVTATLTNETAETDIFILDTTASGCDPTACLGWGYASATVTVKAGQNYYIVVDGFAGANGKYNLELSCVPAVETNCADGIDDDQDGATDCADSDCSSTTVCAPPACVAGYQLTCGQSDSWANYYFGSTNVISNYLGCSNNDAYPAPEYTYKFVAATSGKVTVSMTAKTADTDLILIGGSSGTCSSSQCLAYDVGAGTLTFDAVSGSTYYFVVDGFNGAQGTYTIAVDCQTTAIEICNDGSDNDSDGATDCEDSDCFGVSSSCQPACTPDKVELAQLKCPTDKDSFQNDGSGSTNVITGYSCNTFNYSGNEYAYTFVATADGPVTVTLANETAANGDTDVIVLHDTGLGCNPASCMTTGTSSATFDAKAGQTYYIVIDGYQGANGSYDLAFSCGS
jgi:hypothetical protein